MESETVNMLTRILIFQNSLNQYLAALRENPTPNEQKKLNDEIWKARSDRAFAYREWEDA